MTRVTKVNCQWNCGTPRQRKAVFIGVAVGGVDGAGSSAHAVVTVTAATAAYHDYNDEGDVDNNSRLSLSE